MASGGAAPRFRDAIGVAHALFGGDIPADAFAPASLLDEAQRRTGLVATPAEPIASALSTLGASLREEASLGAFGRLATRSDLVGKLGNLLILDDAERRDPAVADAKVTAPIVITGMPRSGTTFLHGLLATHRSLFAPRTWQIVHPRPSHPAASPRAGPARVERQLRLFGRLVPEFASVHPLGAELPQECAEILAGVFRSLRFEATFHVPSYRDWLRRDGLADAYRFHRRFLRHLRREAEHAGRGGAARNRFVLKSPDHVFALDALRDAYPDARLVFVHRDPDRVLPSVARLTELMRVPFAPGAIDRHAIGRQVRDDWRVGVGAMIAAADRDDAAAPGPDGKRGGIVHVQHASLIADPVGTAFDLLRRLGVETGTADMARIAARVAALPGGGYGRNRYAPAEYGLGDGSFGPLRDAYLSRFAVAPAV